MANSELTVDAGSRATINGPYARLPNHQNAADEAFGTQLIQPSNLKDDQKLAQRLRRSVRKSAKGKHVEQKMRVVRDLLEQGADPNLESKKGHTAMYNAAAHADENIMALLLSFNGDPSKKSIHSEKNSLHVAVKADNRPVAKYLARHYPMLVEENDVRGHTPAVALDKMVERERVALQGLNELIGGENLRPDNRNSVRLAVATAPRFDHLDFDHLDTTREELPGYV